MNVKKLLDSIQKGVEFAEGLLPTLTELGVPGAGLVSLALKAVGAVSEIVPLRTEALVTNASDGVDNLAATPQKGTTTVAMDFGRISLADDLVLYLFGTPGQHRFWFMWDDLIRGAIGAIVLIDTRRLDESFAAVDFFEARQLPFLVAINEFDDAPRYPIEDIRAALAISEDVPIIPIDARDRESAKRALVAITEYALTKLHTAAY